MLTPAAARPQSGKVLLPFQAGELWIKGPQLPPAPPAPPAASSHQDDGDAPPLAPPIIAPSADGHWLGGWFRTGDIGYRDEDGCVHLLACARDLIVTAGGQLSPAELEAPLFDSGVGGQQLGAGAVTAAAAVGTRDASGYEVASAVVVVDPSCGAPGAAELRGGAARRALEVALVAASAQRATAEGRPHRRLHTVLALLEGSDGGGGDGGCHGGDGNGNGFACTPGGRTLYGALRVGVASGRLRVATGDASLPPLPPPPPPPPPPAGGGMTPAPAAQQQHQQPAAFPGLGDGASDAEVEAALQSTFKSFAAYGRNGSDSEMDGSHFAKVS